MHLRLALIVAVRRPTGGLSAAMVRLVAQEMGLEVVFEREPQLRSFRRLQSGEIDAAFASSYSLGRLPYGRYPMRDGKPDESARLFSQSYVFYRLKGSPFTWDGRAVSGLGEGAIGFNSTFSIGAELNRWGLRTEDAKTTEQNFQKLSMGRIMAFAMQEQAADSYLASGAGPWVRPTHEPLTERA